MPTSKPHQFNAINFQHGGASGTPLAVGLLTTNLSGLVSRPFFHIKSDPQ
ncbi:hypothetical protein SAMN02745166_02705 [Prosthecobacter debontii]|uniref:Uncharacterized protein n=1 Tax=Prosthecobacter debontii TaxID=48467 RepID=A0A1T4Y8T6_9BACT|nr:hypothetical protein SAMN02745166_02705 [Prosthecobacter debontii]